MTGACCIACARARGCAETSRDRMLADYQCDLFRPAGLPVLSARLVLAGAIGDTAMWEAVTHTNEEKEVEHAES